MYVRLLVSVLLFFPPPQSVSMGELYGEVNPQTFEWHDGLMATIVRECVKVLLCAVHLSHKCSITYIRIIYTNKYGDVHTLRMYTWLASVYCNVGRFKYICMYVDSVWTMYVHTYVRK